MYNIKRRIQYLYLFLLSFGLCLYFFQCKKGYSIWNLIIKINKVKRIKNDNQLLILQNRLSELEKENNDLKRYKNIYTSLSRTYKYVSFLEIKIIKKNINENIIIAYANNINDINLNDIAVDEFGNFIGRVIKKNNDGFVKIQIITDLRSNIPSMSLDGKILGIVVGDNKKECNLIFRTFDNENDYEIKDNDIIITSGFEGLIPRGITIGFVEKKNGYICIKNEGLKNINNIAIIREKYV